MQYDKLIDKLIDLAIEEDIATGDVTTNSIIPANSRAVAEMKMKADGVISGLEIAGGFMNVSKRYCLGT